MIKAILISGIVILYTSRFRPSVLKRIGTSGKKDVKLIGIELLTLIAAGLQLYFTEIEFNPLTYAGLTIFLTGLFIATTARLQLKKNYMPAFSSGLPNAMITNGMYKVVRHPIYLGMILYVTGFELVLEPMLAMAGLVAILIFAHEIKKEEALLSQSKREEWELFAERTKYRLIPFVW